MSETKPFRTPLFRGIRIVIRANGDILNARTRKRVAAVDGLVRIVDNSIVPVGQTPLRHELFLSHFYASDFAPILKRLNSPAS